jgi:predicted ATPase
MRIAISGTHSQGKSTFVNDWTNRHHRYIREQKPFRALHDEGYDIRFRQESMRLHNGIQMYYNISRLMRYQQDSDCVIFDRCPVDYIAYSQYTANHGTTDINYEFVDSLAERVRDSLQNLDLLIFLPITSEWSVAMENDGIRPIDLPYRDEVDSIFKQIYREQRFSVMPINNPPVLIELWGAREDRLNSLDQAIEYEKNKRI